MDGNILNSGTKYMSGVCICLQLYFQLFIVEHSGLLPKCVAFHVSWTIYVGGQSNSHKDQRVFDTHEYPPVRVFMSGLMMLISIVLFSVTMMICYNTV